MEELKKMAEGPIWQLGVLFRTRSLADYAEKKRLEGDFRTYAKLSELFRSLVGIEITDRNSRVEELLSEVRQQDEDAYNAILKIAD